MRYFFSLIKKFVLQFPFVVPKSVIHSCEEWIIDKSKNKGTYFNQRGPWCLPIFEKEFVKNSAPNTVGGHNIYPFIPNITYYTNKSTLFYLQNIYLMGHKGLVMTVDNRVFQEFSHHFKIASLKKYFIKNPFFTFTFKAKKMPGVAAVLISPESQNYYHWLNDVMPRIKIYESVINQIDHFCISSAVPKKFMDILPNFGIATEKILLVHPKEKLFFDHLYVSSLPGSEGRSPAWAMDYLRSKLMVPEDKPEALKKIYFRRGDKAARKLLNEPAVVEFLSGNGFSIIDPDHLSIREQIELMQQSQVVIGVHGAALTNLIFLQKGQNIIEIFSPDYFRTDCYFTASAYLQLNYWYILGEKPVDGGWGEIILPVALLKETLDKIKLLPEKSPV